MVYLIYPDTPHVYIYMCVSSFTQNGCSLTEYGQGCLNFASATFHDVKIPRNFSIPKIRNYRRYHPQMVALRQWLSHMIHPLGHPWAIPWAKPKPRSRRSTLEHWWDHSAGFSPGKIWRTKGFSSCSHHGRGSKRGVRHGTLFFSSKRGSSLEVSKWSSDMIMIFPLFQVRIMQIPFLHPYFQFVSSDDPGSLSGRFNPRVVGHKSLLPLNIGVYREIQVI